MTPARLIILCIGMTILSGCAARQAPSAAPAGAPVTSSETLTDAPHAAPAGEQSIGWNTTPLAVRSEPVAVKEGPAPLVYLVETPGVFRVHDLTEGRDLARVNAAGRSIVRVEGRTGVVFGRETLLPGPLDRDHRYVIYRDPTGPNMARQGTFQVLPPPRTKSQPSQSSPQDRGGQDQEGDPHVDR